MSDRRYPIGPAIQTGGVDFRVWAPNRQLVTVIIEDWPHIELQPESNGYFSTFARGVEPGDRYRFTLDDLNESFPDPASQFQPQGPHGPSQVVDSTHFAWTDIHWKGRPLDELVIYEMHIGTFTSAGTWSAAQQQLAELARIGITCIEVMPVADFVGEFGWGYDGVNLFAPTRLYGTPDEMRAFVNEAHAQGIAVVLDVVYNHLGPDGNFLGQFSAAYFTDRYKTDWGAAINFDGEQSAPVREFYSTNAAYWIKEFHLDGLRLDATQNIYDKAPPPSHIIAEMARAARAAAPDRHIILIAENEPQHPHLCRPTEAGGCGLDALWNDDFHHSAMVALTGHREAYYKDYLGSPQEFISAAKYGYLYQGQWYSWQHDYRGLPGLDLKRTAFINFLQNHDQVANSGRGLRIHQLSSPALCRAMTVLSLLMPGTPMLFQGQEFAASSPFFYFADHNPDLAAMVQSGRAAFLGQFPSLSDPGMIEQLAAPHDKQTFVRCRLDFSERQSHSAAYRLTQELLGLRAADQGLRPSSTRGVDGAVIGPHAFLLRYFTSDRRDRLLISNLGQDLELAVVPEPLLAPCEGCRWHLLLSSEDPCFGGNGIYEPQIESGGWMIPGHAAIVLAGQPDVHQQRSKA